MDVREAAELSGRVKVGCGVGQAAGVLALIPGVGAMRAMGTPEAVGLAVIVSAPLVGAILGVLWGVYSFIAAAEEGKPAAADPEL